MKKLLLTLFVLAGAMQISAQSTDEFDGNSIDNWELVYSSAGQGVVSNGKMHMQNNTDTEWITVFRKQDTANTTDFEVSVNVETQSYETQAFGIAYDYDRETNNYQTFVMKNNKASIMVYREGKIAECYETTFTASDLKKYIKMTIKSSEGGINFTINGTVVFTLKNKPITHKGVGLTTGPSNLKLGVDFDKFTMK